MQQAAHQPREGSRQPPPEPPEAPPEPDVAPDADWAGDEDPTAWRERLRRVAAHSPRESRYTILGEIARGGMGRVLRVWDEDLRRMLAMKIIEVPEGTENERAVERFVEEAQVTGQLDHPGIVPVHEIGIDGENHIYYTMPLVKGQDLRKVFGLARAGDEGWNPTRAVQALVKVGETVAYAHQKGVIHRDLKPSNIMVGRFGEVFVMDWGLALRRDRARVGAIVGTPAYMPPEQARGDVKVGPQVDVYALGAILYELLSGHLPYGDATDSAWSSLLVDRILVDPPTPLARVDRRIPPELIAVCEKAMERDMADRYATVAELTEDLRCYLDGRVVAAYESGRWARLRKWVTRNPRLAATLATIAVLLAALAFERNLRVIRVAEARDREMREAYVANLSGAAASLRVDENGDAKRRLEACEDDLRGWEWRHLSLKADSSLLVLPGHEDDVNAVAFDPAGERIATASVDGRVRVWNAQSGEQEFSTSAEKGVLSSIAFDPLGECVAAGAEDGHVWIWSADDGVFRAKLSGHAESVKCIAFTSDGLSLASGSYDGTIRIRDLTGAGNDLEIHVGEIVQALAFSPDDGRLVAADALGNLMVWDAATGEQLVTAHDKDIAESLAFEPGGDALAVGYDKGFVRVLDGATLRVLTKFAAHTRTVKGVAFSPDGDLLTTVSLDHSLAFWDARTGSLLARRLGHDEGVKALAFHPDGTRVVTGSSDQTARVWSVHEVPTATLRGHENWVEAVAFEPSGARIASASRDRTVRLWNAATGAEEASFAMPAPAVCLDFRPDGSELAVSCHNDTVRVLSLPGGELLRELTGFTNQVTAVRYSRQGDRLLTRSIDGTVRIWDGSGEAMVITLEGERDEYVAAADFHPDGERFAIGMADGRIELRDADTGALRRTIAAHPREVTALRFDAEGRFLLSGSVDGDAAVHDPDSGKRLHTLGGHEARITSVDFDREGERMLTGSKDRTLRLWSFDQDEALLTLRGHEDWITSVAFGPNGQRLASGSWDRSLRVWNAR